MSYVQCIYKLGMLVCTLYMHVTIGKVAYCGLESRPSIGILFLLFFYVIPHPPFEWYLLEVLNLIIFINYFISFHSILYLNF